MKTHTIRIEKNASLTYRNPAGRLVGWTNPAGLAALLREGRYRLDLHKPLSLKNLKTQADIRDAYTLQREFSKLTAEEWAALVIQPEPVRLEHMLLFDPDAVQMRRSFWGFPVMPLLSIRSDGSWGWHDCAITPTLAKELGLIN